MTLARHIQKALSNMTRAEQSRTYIGASIVASPCDRELFYIKERVQQAPNDAQSLRIFDFGNAIETLAVEWLRAAGFFIYDRSPVTGEQFRVTLPTGETLGHADGIIATYPLHPDLFTNTQDRTTPRVAILEIKSHNARSFNAVVNLGVERAKFEHFAQMQCYINGTRHLATDFNSNEKINTAIYVAVNKDTCEIHIEEVPADNSVFVQCLSRIRATNRASAPPPRIKSSASLSPCKWCNYKIHCFKDNRTPALPERAPDAVARGAVVQIPVSSKTHSCDPEWWL